MLNSGGANHVIWPSADLMDFPTFEKVVLPAVSKDVRDSLLRRQLITSVIRGPAVRIALLRWCWAVHVTLPAVRCRYYELSASKIMPNTSVLWGRGIVQVQCSATGAIALSETGDLFVWGGTQQVRLCARCNLCPVDCVAVHGMRLTLDLMRPSLRCTVVGRSYGCAQRHGRGGCVSSSGP